MGQCKSCGCWPKSTIKCEYCQKNPFTAAPAKEEAEKRPKPIAKVSEKQAKKNAEKKDLQRNMAVTKKHECSGCGDKDQLTHSHLVSVGQRAELRNDPLNIVYHCVQCHNVWEHDHQARKLMPDYHENMSKIKLLDPLYYIKLVDKHAY